MRSVGSNITLVMHAYLLYDMIGRYVEVVETCLDFHCNASRIQTLLDLQPHSCESHIYPTLLIYYPAIFCEVVESLDRLVEDRSLGYQMNTSPMNGKI